VIDITSIPTTTWASATCRHQKAIQAKDLDAQYCTARHLIGVTVIHLDQLVAVAGRLADPTFRSQLHDARQSLRETILAKLADARVVKILSRAKSTAKTGLSSDGHRSISAELMCPVASAMFPQPFSP
jgi:hypothetical protein